MVDSWVLSRDLLLKSSFNRYMVLAGGVVYTGFTTWMNHKGSMR